MSTDREEEEAMARDMSSGFTASNEAWRNQASELLYSDLDSEPETEEELGC